LIGFGSSNFGGVRLLKKSATCANSSMRLDGFEGLEPQQIDWVWIVEEKHRATPDEVKKLCKAVPKR
jgi:hypothetical protein